MDTSTRARITSVLWPARARTPTSVWALLDLARDRRIHPLLVESRLEFLCLYAGRLSRRLILPVSILIGLFFGSAAWDHWEAALQFLHQMPFGEVLAHPDLSRQ